ncbi:UNVERIFIED_CONTAM: hypothetical protein RMT77_010222 [Armadillidium vulgare]
MSIAVPRIFLYDPDRKLQKRQSNRKKSFRNYKNGSNNGQLLFPECLWIKTQELMEKSEQLARLITHVCTHKLKGVIQSSISCPRHHTECGRIVEEFGGSDTVLPISEHGKFTHNHVERCIVSYPFLQESEWKNYHNRLRHCADDERGRRMVCSNNRREEEESQLLLTSNQIFQYNNNHNKDPSSSGLKGSGAGPPSGFARDFKSKNRKRGGISNFYSCLRSQVGPFFNITFYAFFFLLVASLAGVVESCSSRSTPKPRPASATLRPNVTFPTYACPPAYAAWFCLNGATCFTVKIQDAILYNCECAEGYMGPRCEFKDLDGSYLPARERVLLETASIAGGACIAIVMVFLVLFGMYVFLHKDREKMRNHENPYYDKRPLKTLMETDYICTITPVHIQNQKKNLSPQVSKNRLFFFFFFLNVNNLYLFFYLGLRKTLFLTFIYFLIFISLPYF